MEQSDPYWKTHWKLSSNPWDANIKSATSKPPAFVPVSNSIQGPDETIEGDETTLHDHIDEKPHC